MRSDLNTDLSLARVVAHIQAHETAIDLLVLTGDLAQHPEPQVYARLLQHVSVLHVPIICLPGNHDDLTVMQEVAARYAVQVLGEHNADNWQLLFLNTAQPDKVDGWLSKAELQRVRQALAQSPPDSQLMLFLHHHPVPVGSIWMDAIGLQNALELWDVLAGHNAVRALVCGHVHQAFDDMHQGVRVLATPSSCVQFKAVGKRGELDDKPPAYRRLELDASGALTTEIVWVS